MYHLAHLNIVRMRAPLEDPLMQRFVDWLDPVFGLADESEGFVWRLQTEDGLASADRTFDDEPTAEAFTFYPAFPPPE